VSREQLASDALQQSRASRDQRFGRRVEECCSLEAASLEDFAPPCGEGLAESHRGTIS
jgi:hypothetical protein